MREAETVRRYAPDPLGQRTARNAVCEFYQRRGAATDPAHILLTPGTSVAYLYALRLLADRGDEILVPSPGYPLFDDIAAICGVGLRRYHLAARPEGWRPDLDEIAFQCTERTRAVMVISPHNPTGTVWGDDDLAGLAALCRERDLAVVFDEVFSEFLTPPLARLPRPVEFPLCVTLNGFSKMFALPGWKIGWMKVEGDAAWRDSFLRALAHIADTLLPVGELQQAMIPALMAAGDPAVSGALSETLSARRQIALDALDAPPPTPEGGVSLCCPLPEGVDDEAFAIRLLEEHGVAVHPGHFYDLPRHAVMTCIAEPSLLRAGIARFNAAVAAPAAGA